MPNVNGPLCLLVALASGAMVLPAGAEPFRLCGRESNSLPALMVDLMRLAEGLPHHEDTQFLALSDRQAGVMFTFTKPGHPAHPAVVCRRPQQNTAGGFSIQIESRCGAEKSACDALVESFRRL